MSADAIAGTAPTHVEPPGREESGGLSEVGSAVPDQSTSAVLAAARALQQAVDALQAATAAGLPEAELVAALDLVETQSRRLPSVRDALVAEVHARGLADSHGFRSTGAWLRSRFRLTAGEARTWLRGAERLTPRRALTGESIEPVLPATAAARAAGALSAAQVKVLDDLDEELPRILPTAVRREIETAMVEYAAQFDPVKLTRIGQRLLDAVDPDGAEPAADEAHRRRGITIGPLRRGLARVSGHVDAWTREAILSVLAALSDPDPAGPSGEPPAGAPQPGGDRQPCGDAPENDRGRQPNATTSTEGAAADGNGRTTDRGAADHGARDHRASSGADATDGDIGVDRPLDPDRRSHPQRLHDALRDACERLLASRSLPVRAGTPATILLTVPLETLETRTGLISTAHGGDLPVRDVIRRAGDSTIVPIVIDRRGNPLFVGRRQRLANSQQRQALHVRDGGCVIPGCTTPSQDCHTHHLQDWARGGRTDINNLALLCAYHHHRISGWSLEVKHGRVWCQPPSWMNHSSAPAVNTYFRAPPALRQLEVATAVT